LKIAAISNISLSAIPLATTFEKALIEELLEPTISAGIFHIMFVLLALFGPILRSLVGVPGLHYWRQLGL
jgi:hypothetical protein